MEDTAAAVSFLNRLRPITASTKRSCLLSSKGVAARYRPAVWLSGDRVALYGLPVSCPSARWRGPFFGHRPWGDPSGSLTFPPQPPETPVVADARALSLAPGRRLRRASRGVSLSALVGPCAFRSTGQPSQLSWLRMVPATSALLSLLVLKLLDKNGVATSTT